VDTGFASSKKSSTTSLRNTPFHARTGIGPGVFIGGADAPQTDPCGRSRADAVRRGNPSAAVPL